MYELRARSGLLVGVLSLFPSAALAQSENNHSLGTVHFEVSCAEAGQARFDRAVTLLHHMTYTQARSDFSALAADDPACAMAHWGIAMTYFQPLWPTRPSQSDLDEGWREISLARTLQPVSRLEAMFIEATAAFFDPAAGEYWQRIAAWEKGMRAVYDAYPDDVEARAFYALAHLATAPASGDLSHQEQVAPILESVLRDRLDHPGVVHYLIHASDAAGRENSSLEVVRRYDRIAPRNPHALHMPTHIYVRLGDWDGVIKGNQDAAEAALEHRAGDKGQYVWDEFPHAIEYLVYAFLQVGDDAAALASINRLQQTRDIEPTFKTAFHLASLPARYALERHDWVMATNLEPRPHPSLAWDRFPWPEAVSWFARGLGAVHTNDLTAAKQSEVRLAQLRDASSALGETLFARQTEILRLEVAAWIAHADDQPDQAIDLMQQAVHLEATTPKPPVTPAPTIPAAELLGDLLLALDRNDEALRAYESALRTTPRRFNSLLGAARAALASGNAELAAKHYADLRKLAAAASPRPGLAEAIAYLKR